MSLLRHAFKLNYRVTSSVPLLQGETEGRAVAVGIVIRRYRAAVQLDDMLDDGQAESGAPFLAASAGIDPVETLEESRNTGSGDARAGVTDRNADELILFNCLDRDVPALRRVLDGIVQQIDQHLLKPPLVSHDR